MYNPLAPNPMRIVVSFAIVLHLICISTLTTYGQIIIGSDGRFTRWDGCLYRKVRLSEENETNCYQCSIDLRRNNTVEISKTDWSQEFINCTDYCDYPTICTKGKYYSTVDVPPVERPLCYQCENRKNEEIWFESKYRHDLCPQDCRKCATMVDISEAVKCAPICRGYPTFCSMKTKFKEPICYQASAWYGCDFLPINWDLVLSKIVKTDQHNKVKTDCETCAIEASTTKNAQYCSYVCGSYPTYFDGKEILQCQPHAYSEDIQNDLFMYNIPNKIMNYLHMSNASYLYPADVMEGKIKYLDGHLMRKLTQRFDIARLNAPLPLKYRMRQHDNEKLEFSNDK